MLRLPRSRHHQEAAPLRRRSIVTINLFWQLLNEQLALHDQRHTDYATANHYYLARATVVEAYEAIMRAREPNRETLDA